MMNLGKIKKISAFIRKVKAIFIDVGALNPRTMSPIAKRNELIKDIWEGFRLFFFFFWPLFGVTIECLIKLVEIFSTPAGIRKSSLEVSNMLLHLPLLIDGLEDASFSINFVAALEIFGLYV